MYLSTTNALETLEKSHALEKLFYKVYSLMNGLGQFLPFCFGCLNTYSSTVTTKRNQAEGQILWNFTKRQCAQMDVPVFFFPFFSVWFLMQSYIVSVHHWGIFFFFIFFLKAMKLTAWRLILRLSMECNAYICPVQIRAYRGDSKVKKCRQLFFFPILYTKTRAKR